MNRLPALILILIFIFTFIFYDLGFNEKSTRSPYVRAGRAGSVSTLMPGTDTETGVSTHSSTVRSLSKPEVLKSTAATGTGKGASTYGNSGTTDKDGSNAHTPVRFIAIASKIIVLLRSLCFTAAIK